MIKEYRVQGMTCGECSKHVEILFKKTKGVITVRVELSEGIVYVNQEHPLDLRKLGLLLEDVGYKLG